MYGKLVWFDRLKGMIEINGNKVTSYLTKDFIAALNAFQRSNDNLVTIDFRRVENAYPGGMLPIICSLENLRNSGYKVDVLLPDDERMYQLFHKTNWAHFLDPHEYEISDTYYDRHLATTHFIDHNQQKKIVDNFVDLVTRNIELSADVLRALEWSVNEITDNVINHSNSENGGYFQAVVFPTQNSVNFAVVDSGQGILSSLKERYPRLKDDNHAIAEAVKEGVTRDPQKGQGNGLFGTLSVCTSTNGSFEILTGRGRFVVGDDNTDTRLGRESESYQGTLVNGTVKTNTAFNLSEVMKFQNRPAFSPSSMIDSYYEHDEKDAFVFHMKNETGGFGNRRNGSQLRSKALNFLQFQKDKKLIIDWTDVPMISSSFADEFIGKLFLEMGMITFSARIQNIGMTQLIMDLIDKAAAQRLVQARDE